MSGVMKITVQVELLKPEILLDGTLVGLGGTMYRWALPVLISPSLLFDLVSIAASASELLSDLLQCFDFSVFL